MLLDAALGVLEPEGPNGTGTRWRGPEAAPPAGQRDHLGDIALSTRAWTHPFAGRGCGA
jgi:hypothetical protein